LSAPRKLRDSFNGVSETLGDSEKARSTLPAAKLRKSSRNQVRKESSKSTSFPGSSARD